MRSSILLIFAACAIVALLAACGGGGDKQSPADHALAICAASPDASNASVSSADITEASGIVSSRENDGVLWVHNDSGDTARVFAIGRNAALLGTYSLSGADAIDWEDMAAGPGPDKDATYLYLADIGDNAAQRPDVVVYRVHEPEVSTNSDTPTANELTDVEKLTLRYPDHAHDAETLLVDPLNGDLLIVTKELAGGPSFVYRAPGSIEPGVVTTLEEVATINFAGLTSAVEIPPDAPQLVRAVPSLPTGGDISPDGSLVAIRTYGTIWVWERPEEGPLWDFVRTLPCEAPSAIEQQGEAIAFDADGSGYTTTSEGANPPLHHFTTK
jgi:hypothetical protein